MLARYAPSFLSCRDDNVCFLKEAVSCCPLASSHGDRGGMCPSQWSKLLANRGQHEHGHLCLHPLASSGTAAPIPNTSRKSQLEGGRNCTPIMLLGNQSPGGCGSAALSKTNQNIKGKTKKEKRPASCLCHIKAV